MHFLILTTLASSALAINPPLLPRITHAPENVIINARQDPAPPTTLSPSIRSYAGSSPCANTYYHWLSENHSNFPNITNSDLRSFYDSQTATMTASLRVEQDDDYKTLSSNYSAICTEEYSDWDTTFTQKGVPSSIQSLHAEFYSSWKGYVTSARPVFYSIASQCLFDASSQDSIIAGVVLLDVATDVKECITAYEVMAYGKEKFVDARTTSTDGAVGARETGLGYMAAVAAVGVVGVGMM
ncbi:hypothetical protein QBC38DRAFT_446554 [Podospora fimiseda]|uniref:Infection structure specific protein n=1 Tax=Podospora fimiseda TaxID=252190 RepID=A0AAN7BJ90_9PEZI|nr:hypothetical protein QBC38DRAFT_446554 [Podospora fimiseda]